MKLGLVIATAALSACTVGESVSDDADLDADEELGDILDDFTQESGAADGDTSEMPLIPSVACTKQRFLHIANWSWVAPLGCINGVCPNGCWGYQRRTSGFYCDYDGAQGDAIKTGDGGGAFASYNEIKPLNTRDATAVANCRAQSGHPVRTYVVWNGSGWNNEGIAAAVHYAEVYGTQAQAQTSFWTWYNGYRSGYAPMANISPETGVSFEETKAIAARVCSATRNGWAGLYFYDGSASGGVGMSAWKREAIIRGMNYCTTH